MLVMLNPSVGLIVLISSPLMRFTTVVLPALSRPLGAVEEGRTSEVVVGVLTLVRPPARPASGVGHVHHEDAHLALLGFDLLQDG